MKCEAKTEVYSRVTGYFSPVSQWNKGKKEEFNNRKKYNVGKALNALSGDIQPLGYCQKTGILADYWTKQDVIDYVQENGISITREQAAEVLKTMERNYDASVGYNWDAMGLAISQVMEANKTKDQTAEQVKEIMKNAEVNVEAKGQATASKVAVAVQEENDCRCYDEMTGHNISTAPGMTAAIEQARNQGYEQVRELQLNAVNNIPPQYMTGKVPEPNNNPGDSADPEEKKSVRILNEGSHWQCYVIDEFGTQTPIKHASCSKLPEALKAAAANGYAQYTVGQVSQTMDIAEAIKKWKKVEQAETAAAAVSQGTKGVLGAINAIMTGNGAAM